MSADFSSVVSRAMVLATISSNCSTFIWSISRRIRIAVSLAALMSFGPPLVPTRIRWDLAVDTMCLVCLVWISTPAFLASHMNEAKDTWFCLDWQSCLYLRSHASGLYFGDSAETRWNRSAPGSWYFAAMANPILTQSAYESVRSILLASSCWRMCSTSCSPWG